MSYDGFASEMKPHSPMLNIEHPDAPYLIGAWLLSEGGGTIAHDSSGRKWDGTITGMEPADWELEDGGSLVFDSTAAEYIDLGLVDIPAEHFTFICRVRPDATGADRRIFSKADGTAPSDHNFMINTRPDGDWRTRMRIDGSVKTDIAGIPDIFVVGEWHTYGVLFDGRNLRAFKDGLEFFAVTHTGVLTATDDLMRVTIGRNGGDTTDVNSWQGNISYCMLWNRAFSCHEMREHMADPYAMFRPSRRVWRMPGISIPIAMHHYKQLMGVN